MAQTAAANAFAWLLPSISCSKTTILCHGYFRQSAMLNTDDDAYHNIIRLCTNYLGDELHDIKHTKVGHVFLSNCFTLNNLTFVMEFYPKGISLKKPHKISLALYLLPFHSINQHSINLCLGLQLRTRNNVLWSHNQNHLYLYNITRREPAICVSKLDIRDIDNASINLSLHFEIIYSNIKLTSTPYYFSIAPLSNSHIWNINAKQHVIAQLHPLYYQTSIVCIHTLKWNVLYNFDKGLFKLQMMSFPVNIKTIFIHYTLTVDDLYRISKCVFFTDQKTNDCYSPHENVHWKKLEHAERVTFKLSITLLNIYGDEMMDNNMIKDRYHANRTPFELQSGSYRWRIPYLTDKHTEYLCSGYIKSMQLPYYVPSSLMDLCRLFVDDAPILDEVKKGRNEPFETGIFVIHGLKYKMRVYSKPNTQRFNWYFCLMSLSPNISSITVFFRLWFEEKHIISSNVAHFDRASWKGCSQLFMLNKEIQPLSSLTFHLETVVVDVLDMNKKSITDYSIYLSNTSRIYDVYGSHKWEITDKQTLNAIKNAANSIGFFGQFFEVHGFKYVLEFYPNGESMDDIEDSTLYLTIASFPPYVACIVVEYTLICEETNVRFSRISRLDAKQSSKGWTADTLKYEQVKQLDSLTFGCVISLIDVYDINGASITARWMHKYRHKPVASRVVSPNVCEYEWKISKTLMTEIKAAANCRGYQSDIFMMDDGWQWMLEMFPNGNCVDCEGNVNVFLHLVSIPMELETVYFQSEIFVEATKTQYQLIDMFTHKDTSTGWPDGKLMTKQIEDLDEMVLKISIAVIDVFGKNGDALNKEMCCDKVRRYKSLFDIMAVNFNVYRWRIDDVNVLSKIKAASNGEKFESEVFEMNKLKWFISMYPNGENKEDSGKLRLCVNLKEMTMKIKCVSFYFELWIMETDTRYCNFCHFVEAYLRKGWRGCYFTFDQIQTLETITIQMTLSLMDVYDDSGVSVLYNFIS